jgi:hypothetical protein
VVDDRGQRRTFGQVIKHLRREVGSHDRSLTRKKSVVSRRRKEPHADPARYPLPVVDAKPAITLTPSMVDTCS